MIKSKMSLNQTVTKAVNEVINKFIKNIATKYDLDPNELLAEWEDNSTSKVIKQPVINQPVNKQSDKKSDIPSANDDIDQNTLTQYKKTELQDLCRKRSLKCTGTKEQLISFLLEKDVTLSEKPKKAETKIVSAPVVKKLTSSIPTVAIRRNQFGNHEHPNTSLIFDKNSKKAIGKQNEDGTIEDLTEDDIDICNQWKFSYIIPDNLDKKIKLTDVKVEELEDEEILESDEEEEVPVEDEIADDELIEEEEDFEDEYEDDEDVEYE